MKTAIIIPCYNEAKRLDKQAFSAFILEDNNYHLCFVNDGSKDNTLEVLHELQKVDENKVSVIDMKRNSGKATAVRAGARYLYSRSDVKQMGFIDADLSTDFKDFDELVKKLEDNTQLKMVFGSRNSGDNDGIKRDGSRKLLSNIVKLFIYMILGLPIKDTQCGAKVFTRDVIPTLYGRSFKSKWLFDVEIFLRLKRSYGNSKMVMNHILEVPLKRWVHMDDSKLGMVDSLKIPLALMEIWLSYNTPSFEMKMERTFEPEVTPSFSIA